jgi:hypothetical protein
VLKINVVVYHLLVSIFRVDKTGRERSLSWASESDRSPGEPIYFERRSLHHSQAILPLLLAASKVTLS